MAAPKRPTADEKVLSAISWGHEKQICGESFLEWYNGLKAANEGKAPPPPPPEKKPPVKIMPARLPKLSP